MEPVIRVEQLHKAYKSGFVALNNINLNIQKGEIFALLGPNGAGKTTLISIICGIVNSSSGSVAVGDADIQKDYRDARSQIGLVPQELSLSMFESVWATVKFSRGLYGQPANDTYLESLLRKLSLWEKRHERIMSLSGGMKRRVLIAKALSHTPTVLFLDEPTAGVDVELRQDMWSMIRELRDTGVTIILTTHYIEEAEEMADRIGFINKGEIVMVDDKAALMKKLGRKELTLELPAPLTDLPESLSDYDLTLDETGSTLRFEFDSRDDANPIPALLKDLTAQGIEFKDLHTRQRSLEDIFVSLVGGKE
ncbi:ABC transporter ATP-binding protein [Teredinibacter turnerae]|uniref:ABC transporter ATP-binding protein n=1 Tax=Teredinibacter turnerae TaxID=2426 RepID=UPI0005F7CF2F|nr:ABC transporter ATP-binding protein [Teredinibacter turnerae]